jgi:hypothetical protein
MRALHTFDVSDDMPGVPDRLTLISSARATRRAARQPRRHYRHCERSWAAAVVGAKYYACAPLNADGKSVAASLPCDGLPRDLQAARRPILPAP